MYGLHAWLSTWYILFCSSPSLLPLLPLLKVLVLLTIHDPFLCQVFVHLILIKTLVIYTPRLLLRCLINMLTFRCRTAHAVQWLLKNLCITHLRYWLGGDLVGCWYCYFYILFSEDLVQFYRSILSILYYKKPKYNLYSYKISFIH